MQRVANFSPAGWLWRGCSLHSMSATLAWLVLKKAGTMAHGSSTTMGFQHRCCSLTLLLRLSPFKA